MPVRITCHPALQRVVEQWHTVSPALRLLTKKVKTAARLRRQNLPTLLGKVEAQIARLRLTVQAELNDATRRFNEMLLQEHLRTNAPAAPSAAVAPLPSGSMDGALAEVSRQFVALKDHAQHLQHEVAVAKAAPAPVLRPVFNITLPEMKPQVHVHVPEARPTSKRVVRGEDGKIIGIEDISDG